MCAWKRLDGLGSLLLAAAGLIASPAPAPASARGATAWPLVTDRANTAIDPARLSGLADFVDGVMAQQIASREVAGAVVSVVYDGQDPVHPRLWLCRYRGRRAVDPLRTLFRPGSVSKLFT